jgi:G6PDH family F420-dependent oxidoreductase
MLEEAVEVMRTLWTGDLVNHHGRYYTVENARIYSLPSQPPPVLVSAFGPTAVQLAARIGDGYINTSPDADLVAEYAEAGGTGPKMAGMKVCWGADEEEAKKLAHQLWRTTGVPGQLSQDLAVPALFAQAAELVTVDKVAESITCGPDPERHAAAVQEYLDAGFDEVYISQVGPDQAGFFAFFEKELAPRLGI